MTRVDIYTSEDRRIERKQDRELLIKGIIFVFKWWIPVGLLLSSIFSDEKNFYFGLIGFVWLATTIYFSFFKKKRR